MARCPQCNGFMFEKNRFCSRKCHNESFGFTEEAPVSLVMEKTGQQAILISEDLDDS